MSACYSKSSVCFFCVRLKMAAAGLFNWEDVIFVAKSSWFLSASTSGRRQRRVTSQTCCRKISGSAWKRVGCTANQQGCNMLEANIVKVWGVRETYCLGSLDYISRGHHCLICEQWKSDEILSRIAGRFMCWVLSTVETKTKPRILLCNFSAKMSLVANKEF